MSKRASGGQTEMCSSMAAIRIIHSQASGENSIQNTQNWRDHVGLGSAQCDMYVCQDCVQHRNFLNTFRLFKM